MTVQHYSFRLGVVDLTVPEDQLYSYIVSLVIPELQEDNIENLPILKATCLKFIYLFRNQIPDANVLNFMELTYKFLKSGYKVNYSYASSCIEKLLIKKSKATGQLCLTKDMLNQDLVNTLLTGLCEVLSNEDGNQYAMRALYRVIQVAQEKIQNVSGQIG